MPLKITMKTVRYKLLIIQKQTCAKQHSSGLTGIRGYTISTLVSMESAHNLI